MADVLLSRRASFKQAITTARSNRTEPHAHIWISNDAKMRYFYRPALLTLQAGLLSANITAQLTSWQWSVLEDLGPGDVFIFVGVASLDPFKRRLKALTDKGVLTVFYSTEADFAHKCSLKQSIHVREVWEYTQSNVLCCQSFSRRPWRYVPPGYIPRTQIAASAATAKHLSFIGSSNVHYDKRRSCLRKVARGLMLAADSSTSERNLTQCADRLCMPGFCAKTCSLRIRNGLLDDSKWDKELSGTASFLNVHKGCNGSALASVAACESFRFAPLLSAGAEIFSEHCHPADEAEYAGLIQFAPVGDLPKLAATSWRDGDVDGPQRRLEAFKQRFSPSVIFERAGITAMLAANRAVWQIGGRQAHLHVRNSSGRWGVPAGGGEFSSQVGSALLPRPSHCH